MSNISTQSRNEAIEEMMGSKFKYYYLFETPDYNCLMRVYEFIESLGYLGNIEKLKHGDHRVWFTDMQVYEIGTGHRGELKEAIFLTVSDFAIEYNKKKGL
jgi:hypothetical protein